MVMNTEEALRQGIRDLETIRDDPSAILTLIEVRKEELAQRVETISEITYVPDDYVWDSRRGDWRKKYPNERRG